ncbi:LOW QUALITY PROTEIN: hypothetical protein PHMEG_00031239 [Phytophthora megakarya]|uniref:Uncharacterized protein n=1 Tax=Phytophthora megakarya TaxID=4795 RepID=A0A225UZU8_9STRA|nr:LOW QUALITY PROTEIN: hypothetical protein PHMEG_00031239 [Phytophthora megakarya]
MVESEMLTSHNGSTSTMTGTDIRTFLKGNGADKIDDKLHGDLTESYQKLEAYAVLLTGFAKFTILSDRQKKLFLAVKEVFRYLITGFVCDTSWKEQNVGNCQRRIVFGFAEWPGATVNGDYKTFRSELVINHPSAAGYLDGIERCHWVKYAFNEKFGLATFNEITSNLSEQAITGWATISIHLNLWMGFISILSS